MASISLIFWNNIGIFWSKVSIVACISLILSSKVNKVDFKCSKGFLEKFAVVSGISSLKVIKMNLIEYGNSKLVPLWNCKFLDKTSCEAINISPLEYVTSVGTNSWRDVDLLGRWEPFVLRRALCWCFSLVPPLSRESHNNPLTSGINRSIISIPLISGIYPRSIA